MVGEVVEFPIDRRFPPFDGGERPGEPCVVLMLPVVKIERVDPGGDEPEPGRRRSRR